MSVFDTFLDTSRKQADDTVSMMRLKWEKRMSGRHYRCKGVKGMKMYNRGSSGKFKTETGKTAGTLSFIHVLPQSLVLFSCFILKR